MPNQAELLRSVSPTKNKRPEQSLLDQKKIPLEEQRDQAEPAAVDEGVEKRAESPVAGDNRPS
jgi:hypothetical protein